jgi:hypothetical protein
LKALLNIYASTGLPATYVENRPYVQYLNNLY